MIKYRRSLKKGGKLPDHDPSNPYHYHDSNGNKIVITPEEWEENVGKPYFREVEAAVRAEQAAYPVPEYEVNPDFVKDLRSTYRSNMGNGYQNYKNFSSYLPQGYTFSSEGMIVDPQGNYYVQSGYRQTPRFTYSTDNPLNVNLSSINKNLTFYPVNMDKRVKAPLPVDRTLDVSKEYENAVSDYLNKESDLIQVPVIAGNYLSNNLHAYRNREEAKKYIIRDFGINYTPIKELDVDFDRHGNPILIMPKKDFARYRKEQLEYDKSSYKIGMASKNQSIHDFYADKLNRAEEILDSYLKYYPVKPSRKEAEKKAIIKISPLKKVGNKRRRLETAGQLSD